jgi:hypothetical protein
MKVAHYIYFYNSFSKRSPLWDFMRYLSVKSFHVENPDWKIKFYTNKQPMGEWWDRVSDFVEVVMTTEPREIFGNPIPHPAHASDVQRLRCLIEEGGAYCDFDTINIGSFDKLLEKTAVVLGKLGPRQKYYGNGMMVAPKDSLYLKTWYDEYKTFRSKGRDKFWDEHSVKIHNELRERPELVGTHSFVDHSVFYPYSWLKPETLFDEYHPEFITQDTVSVHLYDAVHYKKVNQYSVQQIKENPERSSFTKIANKYL